MYVNPRWVLADFLRSRLIDPREERRPVLKELDITATEGQTEFPLEFSSGKNLSYVSKVSVDGVEKKKWMFYAVDFRDSKIVFYEGLTAGQEVKIELFENNKDWIYWDNLIGDLRPEQYPRVTITIVGGTGTRLGIYKAPVESRINVQFDVYCKQKMKGQLFEIDGKVYTGEELAERISYEIQNAFEDYEDDLHPIMYDYEPNQFPPRNIPFDEELQCHRKIVECELSGIRMGRL